MKILVTGGAGFIGKHLVKFLADEHNVRIYDDLSNSSIQNISSFVDADFVQGDILDYEKLAKSSQGCDVVIHLAAKSNVNESVLYPKNTERVNVEGTQNIVKTCKENKINRIIFASSAAVYGSCNSPLTEISNVQPISPYGKSKLIGEEIIKEIENSVSLRLFNVYGLGQNENYPGVIQKFIHDINKNKKITIFGSGKQTRDFVSIYDVVHAFSSVLNVRGNKTYNIASGLAISINDLAQKLIEISKQNVIVKHESQKDGDIKFSNPSIQLAQKEIGFTPKAKLEEVLKKLLISVPY